VSQSLTLPAFPSRPYLVKKNEKYSLVVLPGKDCLSLPLRVNQPSLAATRALGS